MCRSAIRIRERSECVQCSSHGIGNRKEKLIPVAKHESMEALQDKSSSPVQEKGESGVQEKEQEVGYRNRTRRKKKERVVGEQ